MIIIEAIIKHRTLAAIDDQLQLSELAKLVTDRRFAHTDKPGQITDTHLLTVKGPQNTQPVGISHGLEQNGQLLIFP